MKDCIIYPVEEIHRNPDTLRRETSCLVLRAVFKLWHLRYADDLAHVDRLQYRPQTLLKILRNASISSLVVSIVTVFAIIISMDKYQCRTVFITIPL